MSRKPRIHFPGAVHLVILKGNGGQDIFFSKKDHSKFNLLLREGIEKFGYRVLAYCLTLIRNTNRDKERASKDKNSGRK